MIGLTIFGAIILVFLLILFNRVSKSQMNNLIEESDRNNEKELELTRRTELNPV